MVRLEDCIRVLQERSLDRFTGLYVLAKLICDDASPIQDREVKYHAHQYRAHYEDMYSDECLNNLGTTVLEYIRYDDLGDEFLNEYKNVLLESFGVVECKWFCNAEYGLKGPASNYLTLIHEENRLALKCKRANRLISDMLDGYLKTGDISEWRMHAYYGEDYMYQFVVVLATDCWNNVNDQYHQIYADCGLNGTELGFGEFDEYKYGLRSDEYACKVLEKDGYTISKLVDGEISRQDVPASKPQSNDYGKETNYDNYRDV